MVLIVLGGIIVVMGWTCPYRFIDGMDVQRTRPLLGALGGISEGRRVEQKSRALDALSQCIRCDGFTVVCVYRQHYG